MLDLLSPLGFIIFTTWCSWLVWSAVRPSPNFASWHMFAGVTNARFDLTDASGARFNCWKYLPHTKLAISRAEVDLLLAYVDRVHGLRSLGGTVTCRVEFETHVYRVEQSKIVARVC